MNELRQHALSGVRWNTLGMVATTLLQLAQLLILARLLPPEAFGLMAMAMILVSIGQIFGATLIVDAIIQAPRPDRRVFASIWWLHLMAGAGVFLLLWLGASPAAWLFDAPEVARLVPITGLIFLVLPWGMPYQALLQKDLRFKAVTLSGLTGAVAQFGTAIILAWQGFGVWALVGGVLAEAVGRSLTLLCAGWNHEHRPGLHFRWAEVRSLVAFGLHRAGAQCISSLTMRLDQIFIGRFLGTTALGYYSIAFNLVFQLVNNLVPILGRVALPLFVRLRDEPKALRDGYRGLLGAVAAIGGPAMIGLAAIAPIGIPVLFGDSWRPAIPIVQILTIYGLVVALFRTRASLVMACGRAELLLIWNLLTLTLLTPILFFSAQTGLLWAVAASLVGVHAVLLAAGFRWLIRPLIGGRSAEYFRAIIPPVAAAAAMGGIVVLETQLAGLLGNPWTMGLQIASGVLIYMGLAIRFLPREMAVARELFSFKNRPGKGLSS